MNPRRVFHESRVLLPFLRWIVPAAVILLAVAGSRDSAGSGPAPLPGARVTANVPFVRESIDEIRALAPVRTPGNRAIPFRRIPRQSDAAGVGGASPARQDLAAPSLAPTPAPLAPALDRSFEGLGNPPHSEGDVIPPDTMGAAGPNHLVSLLNSDFGVFDKTTGALIPNQRISLQSFWGSLGTGAGQPADFPFDPKILYDQHSGRFVAITLGGRNAPDSWVLIAVSPPPGSTGVSDPTGAWAKWAIDADLYDGVTQTNNSADYPGLGVDQFNVYITANMFNSVDVAQHGKVWVIPKAQLLDNPGPTITFFEFAGAFLTGFSRQPAHVFGPSAAEYLLSEGGSSRLLLTRIDSTSSTPVMRSPVAVAVSAYVATDNTPGAPQLGNDNTIDTQDTRVLNVVYRNGSVWATHHVVGPSGKVEVAWYRIDPGSGTGTPTVQSQGRVTDPSRWFFYPSIAVNKYDVAAIGFSGSSGTEYVGGYYSVIQPSTGAAESVAQMKAGDAPYWKSFITGGVNRWGDFSATMVDPTDDTSFWTLQEYAKLPVSGISQWGTWWGRFTSPAPPPNPGGGGGGGGGCQSVTRSGREASFGTLLFSVLLLLLPACALGLRRCSRRRERTDTVRHPPC